MEPNLNPDNKLFPIIIEAIKETLASDLRDRDYHMPLQLVEKYEAKIRIEIQEKQISVDDIAEAAKHYYYFSPDHFNSCDVIFDLLRRAADYTQDSSALRHCTELHCMVLLYAADELFERAGGDHQNLYATRSVHISLRARELLEKLPPDNCDPELKIRAHLSVARVYDYPNSPWLYLALSDYYKTLQLMKKYGYADRYHNLLDWLIKITRFIAERTLRGAQFSMMEIESTVDVAKESGDTSLITLVDLARVHGYRETRFFDQAISICRQALKQTGLNNTEYDDLLFELALCLASRSSGRIRLNKSEISEAVSIIKQLLNANSPSITNQLRKAQLIVNLGIMRALEGSYQKAIATFVSFYGKGVENLDPDTHVALLVEWSRCSFLLGDIEESKAKLDQAETVLMSTKPVAYWTHFKGLAAIAGQYWESGDLENARRISLRAHALANKEIERTVDPGMWAAIWSGFRRVDFIIPEYFLRQNKPTSAKTALLFIEEMKARTILRMRALVNLNASYDTNKIRQKNINQRTSKLAEWTAKSSRRAVVSLFAANRGLGVVVIHDGVFTKKWIDSFYDIRFIRQFITPLSGLVDRGFKGDSMAWATASGLVDAALAQIGEAICLCYESVAKGGDELLIIPHRILRALPLAHCRIPGGRRLSDLFKSVQIVTELSLPAHSSPKNIGSQYNIIADPLDDLLMARFEAIRLNDSGLCSVGANATKSRITDALENASIVILACHGIFDSQNPWRSQIISSDGSLELFDFYSKSKNLKTELVYLSACETGMSDITMADEPIGFGGILLMAGARHVISPLMKIDDFASLLFSDLFFSHRKEGLSYGQSLINAARELRGIKAKTIIEYIHKYQHELETLISKDIMAEKEIVRIRRRIDETEKWLDGLYSEFEPFDNILDWGLYQCMVNPFTIEGDIYV